MNGVLDETPLRTDSNFGLQIPEQVPGVPDEVLNPRQTWADQQAYDQAAQDLVERFRNNYEQFAGELDKKVQQAGP